MINIREMVFETVKMLDRFGGLTTASYREDFGYQTVFPDTSGLEPDEYIDRENACKFFLPEIKNTEGTTVVDVGCHTGIRYTSEFARERPKAIVFGIEKSFDPSRFNGDTSVGGRVFSLKEEVIEYLRGLHRCLPNLELLEAHFDSRYPLEDLYDGGQRVLTGYKNPGILGVNVSLQALRAGVNLLITAPTNLGELVDNNGRHLDGAGNYGYTFPMSEYVKGFEIPIELLHRLVAAPFRKRRESDNLVYTSDRDRHNQRVSVLAKQLICLDRALFLEENGMKTDLFRHADIGHGKHAADHLIVARRD